MKNILLLGAGRSATYLIEYLLQHAPQHNWHITLGDVSVAQWQQKLAQVPFAEAIVFNVHDEAQRSTEVAKADLVISLLPALFHGIVAKECLQQQKHLITASYVSAEIKAMHQQAEAAGLTFLMECGLDPGIDHMSAMKIIEELKAKGAKLQSFKSYTGGLVAPESDNNPWHYKITWNPRNVVLAGQGTAKYLEGNQYKYIPYHQLFRRLEQLDVPGYGSFDGYANRDSLSYREPYGLHDIPTILRGTLRRSGYCQAWDALVQLGLTDDSYVLEGSAEMSYSAFTEAFLPASETEQTLQERVATYLQLPELSEEMQRLEWLGLFSNEKIGLEQATPAQVVEQLLTQKWKLSAGDKDMIVMQHLFEYELNGEQRKLTSSLVVLGEDEVHTGMAKTVGLPVAIAAKLLLTGQLQQRGVVIPIRKDLYEPILEELEQYGVKFVEEEQAVTVENC